MMPSELGTYGSVTHFLTKRFDRIGNDRIHIQTLAAIYPDSDSYEDIFVVMRKLNLPYEDIRQQYLRMAFNVLTRNVDDHSKNVAFCMSPDGTWRLSPAYDLTYSVDVSAPAFMNRHSLKINGKNEGITLQDLETVAKNNDIQDYRSLILSVKEATSKFCEFANAQGINQQLIEKINADFIRI